MTNSYINDPEHWRNRAEEMRSLAETVTDAIAKQTMLRIAWDYEHLAQRAEKQCASSENSN